MQTNTNRLTTKEGYQVVVKAKDSEIYHFVPRDERVRYLEKKGCVATIEKMFVKNQTVFCHVIIEGGSANYHGTGSCRLDNTNTDDHAGLAYMKAIDNALKVMGVGMTLKTGQGIATLNRELRPEEKIEQILNDHSI